MEAHKGGEVRRVHVLYFLCRNGAIEHPHLIRVHHLHRNGVYLRDVKRWLAELRGKDMPDSFAWSYKRRYKSGYVWQDLMDDELITPVSDNEYVLKGSDLSSKADFALDVISSDEEAKQSPELKTSPESLHIETDKSVSPKALPEPDQESPGTLPPPPLSGSEMSDDSATRASIIKTGLWEEAAKEEQHTSSRESSRSDSNSNKLQSPQSSKLHSRSGRRTTSHLFRNLFRCGWAETDNSALLTVQRQERYQAVSGGSYKRGKMAGLLRDEKPSDSR